MLPSCYGLVYDQKAEECQCCLAASKCKVAMARATEPRRQPVVADLLKEDRKLLVLKVCRKFNIPTVYKAKKGGAEVEVNEENVDQWLSIDTLISSKAALAIFLATELKGE